MFNRIRDAARAGQAEQKLRAALAETNGAANATVQMRQIAGAPRATVLLPEGTALSGPQVKVLEEKLNASDIGVPVTVVSTAHKDPSAPAGQPSPPTEARIAKGHDNPLSLPGSSGAQTEAASSGKHRPLGVKKVVAIASGKGGVGKSTVTARLALALAARGDKVGILDLDIYGPSLPVLFGLEGQRPQIDDGQVIPLEAAGLKLMSIGFLVDEAQALAWRGPMVMGAAKQLIHDVRWGPLDWLLVDTPPGTGDAHLTLVQKMVLDGVVIVSTPSPLALADVRRGVGLFRRMEVNTVGLVENMATLPDGSPSPFGSGIPESELRELLLPRLSQLPLDADLAALIGRTAPPRLDIFDQLAETLSSRLNA